MQALTEYAHGSPLEVLPECPTRFEMEQFGHFLQGLEPEHGQLDLSTRHHLADRVYGRSAVVKANTFLVGRPHKQGCLVVCHGDITIWSEHGRQRLVGAHILSSPPGAMRIGFAHADTTWLTVHANLTGTEDIRTIEDALVEDADLLLSRRRLQ